MKPIHTNNRRSLTTALCVATLLIATSPTATPFGDNDGGLDLPGLQDPGPGGSGGPGDQQSSQGSGLSIVSLAGADTIVVEASDAALGRVTISADEGQALSIDTSAASNSATQATQSSGLGVSAAAEQGQVALQGGLQLPELSPFGRHLHSPVDTVASIAFVVVDSDPTASLGALLNNNVLLDQWHSVAAPVALDLDEFAQLVQLKAATLAPNGEDVRVTWVVGTLDSAGQMHITAARVSTLGGPIEVVTQ